MVKGAFKRFDHNHYFIPIGDTTTMIDVFDYTSPLGLLGFIADLLFLKAYMTRLLRERNKAIKAIAQSGEYTKYYTPVSASHLEIQLRYRSIVRPDTEIL